MTDDFNLWDDPWIRVLRPDGEREELGIRSTLQRAHELRALHDPSPLTVAGIHRLLTAILQAIYQPQELAQIAALLDAGRFDAAKIDAFGTQFRQRFGLFDPTAPFMQTADAPVAPGKDAKTVAYLLAEVPAGTNRAHFHHVTDDAHRLCPACCARALVVVPAFASSGGAGIKPSINGVPPMYLLPIGATLMQSLARSLTVLDFQPASADPFRPDESAWCGASIVPKAGEITDVGYIESLTFPARRVRLYPQAYHGPCTHCGTLSDVAIAEMMYEMGLSRPKGGELWHDPFVAFRTASTKQIVSVKPQAGQALWREYGTLLLGDAQLRPAILAQTSALVDGEYIDRTALLHFRCVGLRTDGKAKMFEWFDETLDVPPALLLEVAGAEVVREALGRADELIKEVRKTLAAQFRPQGSDRAWFRTLTDRMAADYWAQLAAPFRTLVRDTGGSTDYADLRRRWATEVLQNGRGVACVTLAQVGDAADLLMRRVRAEDRIAKLMGQKRKEWLDG